MGVETVYYKEENARFLKKHPAASRYVYNKETLGFRLDSKQEIGVFRDGAEPQHDAVTDFFGYIKALVGTIMENQLNSHLHSDDWQRTIYIDTLGVGTTDFDLPETMKTKLEQSGRMGADKYFDWFDKKSSKPANRP
jgi:NTE family protein